MRDCGRACVGLGVSRRRERRELREFYREPETEKKGKERKGKEKEKNQVGAKDRKSEGS